MRYAVIENGTVTNVIESEEDFQIDGALLIPSKVAGPGWLYGNDEFSPPAFIPTRVTSRQFKLQLHYAGLLDDVEAWISAQGRDVQIAFEASGTFVRDEPMMQAGFSSLGFTSEQIDAFFVAASQL